MTTASKLTNDMIRESAILSAIPIYLREGETAESIISKFDGDLNKTIIYLRARHFEDMEILERKEKVVKEKPAPKKKPKPSGQEQQNLF